MLQIGCLDYRIAIHAKPITAIVSCDEQDISLPPCTALNHRESELRRRRWACMGSGTSYNTRDYRRGQCSGTHFLQECAT